MDSRTESGSRLPDFLIIGAAKSGTTSLYHYLKAHPGVCMPDWKEPALFSDDRAGGVSTLAEYRAIFGDCPEDRRIGEASVSYVADPEAPGRIMEILGPDVQLVALLRNPVDMAYSNWRYQHLRGVETLDFAASLAAESGRLHAPDSVNGWVHDVAYVTRASYAGQLRRFMDMFGPEQVRVYVFEEFFREGLPLYPDLCRYLGIDDAHAPEAKVHNKGGTIRSAWLRKALDTRMAWKEPLKMIMPQRLRDAITARLRRFNRADTPVEPLDAGLRADLEKRFSPGVRELEDILERDLSEVWF